MCDRQRHVGLGNAVTYMLAPLLWVGTCSSSAVNKNHDLNDIKLGPAGGPLVYARTSQFKLVSVLVIYVPDDWRARVGYEPCGNAGTYCVDIEEVRARDEYRYD